MSSRPDKDRRGVLTAEERARLPKPHGREAVWTALRSRPPGHVWRVSELWHAVNGGQRHRGTDKRSIRGYLEALAAAGIVECDASPVSRTKFYRLTEDPGPVAPRVRRDGSQIDEPAGRPGTPRGDGRQRMWQAMRVLREFDARELMMTASVSDDTACDYCRLLTGAGYLEILQQSSPAGGRRRWRFIAARNTGPLAPRLVRLRAVFDPNLGEVVYAVHRARQAP